MRSVPSKSFLLGEYIALVGGPAIVILHEPKHPAENALGFGSSTAEFILKNDPNLSPEELLHLYKKTDKGSGFDLVAQAYGRSCVITKSPMLEIETFDHYKSPLLLFQASHLPNRKTKTFEHLPTVKVEEKWAVTARSIVQSFLLAHEAKDWKTCGALMNAYTGHLHTQSWVHPDVQKEREQLLKVPGVLGVKGAGAMQTDATWILYDPSRSGAKESAIQAALGLNLRQIALS